jgi:hypothetical protein
MSKHCKKHTGPEHSTTFRILHNCSPPCDIAPPRLRPNFTWTGRYVVSDLFDPNTGKKGITVPFTWVGNHGNIQMTAGNKDTAIYFTNLIYNGSLYSFTYIWPHLQSPFLPPLESTCPVIEEFSLGDLNAILATSRYVGPVILPGNREANHFRLSIVFPQAPPGFHLRFPFASADIFTDRKDPTLFYQVLHFGLHNIYDPALDEWIFLDCHSKKQGEIIPLPPCKEDDDAPKIREVIDKITHLVL